MKRKWILLFIVVTLSLAVLTVCVLFPHYWFIAGEYIGIRCDRVRMEPVELDGTVELTLEEIKASSNTIFDQRLMLINSDHPLPEGFIPDILEYKDTEVMMNSCMLESYQKLSSAVTEQHGEKLYISSDYRTADEQEEIHKTDTAVAAMPGASEHEAGLALDVYVPYYAGFGLIKTDAGRFLNAKCWEYGFIIRYPAFGESKTGIPYEPWHIRYVGEPHAKVIYNNRLTLEEYIISLEIGKWYEIDGYLISRQTRSNDDTLEFPEKFTFASVSYDNTNSYVITVKK